MRFVLLISFVAVALARDIPKGVDRITDIALHFDPTSTQCYYTCVGSKLLRGNAYLFIDAEGSLAGLNATKQIVAFQTISFNKAPSAGELAKLEELLCRRDFENIMTSMDQYCQTYYEEFDTAFTEKCTYGQLYSGA